MNRLLLASLALLLVFGLTRTVPAQTSPTPITAATILSLGPEPLGNLPPVYVPPNNPQTSAKIQLGKILYFDTRLSKDNTISCATCHDPARGWSDAGPTSRGINNQLGGRRSPPVCNSAYNALQFWDGRAPSLEEQAKGPVENPVEMGNTHDEMIRTVSGISGYVAEFEKAFGSPEITVDRVAQAIAAFERTVVTTDSPFDRFVRGDLGALTPEEKKGLEVFNGKGHCTACHWGGNFSDGRFHNLGVEPIDPAQTDEGRFKITQDPKDLAAFKTPTVRDAAARAPYMHTGREQTLEDVVRLYNRGGGTADGNLDPLMVPLGLSEQEVRALVAFMSRAMTSLNPEVTDVRPISQSELPK